MSGKNKRAVGGFVLVAATIGAVVWWFTMRKSAHGDAVLAAPPAPGGGGGTPILLGGEPAPAPSGGGAPSGSTNTQQGQQSLVAPLAVIGTLVTLRAPSTNFTYGGRVSTPAIEAFRMLPGNPGNPEFNLRVWSWDGTKSWSMYTVGRGIPGTFENLEPGQAYQAYVDQAVVWNVQ